MHFIMMKMTQGFYKWFLLLFVEKKQKYQEIRQVIIDKINSKNILQIINFRKFLQMNLHPF